MHTRDEKITMKMNTDNFRRNKVYIAFIVRTMHAFNSHAMFFEIQESSSPVKVGNQQKILKRLKCSTSNVYGLENGRA